LFSTVTVYLITSPSFTKLSFSNIFCPTCAVIVVSIPATKEVTNPIFLEFAVLFVSSFGLDDEVVVGFQQS